MKRKHTLLQTVPNIEQLKAEAAQRRQVLRAAGLTTYQIGTRSDQLSIICLCCGLGSSHPIDIKQRYCGFCKAFHDEEPPHRIRNGEEIQRAHDMLVGLILGDVPEIEVDADALERMNYSCDALCWVLHHEHNDSFAKNLAELEEAFIAAGYILEKDPD